MVEPLPWHLPAWERVQLARKAGRVPHAWLVNAPAMSGLDIFVEALALALLCTAEDAPWPCGRCRSCRLGELGVHPDMNRLTPEEGKSSILIAGVRETIEKAVLSRQMAPYLAVLVTPAEAMFEASASVLLKTLEEPPVGTVFILATTRPSGIMPTVRSR